MGKAEMLLMRKSKKAQAESSERASPDQSEKLSRKRKAPSQSTSKPISTAEEKGPLLGPEAASSRDHGVRKAPTVLLDSPPPHPDSGRRPLWTPETSLFQEDSGPAALHLLQNLLPEVDLFAVQSLTDRELDQKMALGLLQGSFYAAERFVRAAKSRESVYSKMKELDDIWLRHGELVEQLHHHERRALEVKQSFEAELKAVRESAEAAEERANRLVEEAEQERARLFSENMVLESQVRRAAKNEAEWRDKFLKSSEFEAICTDKSLRYFELGFQGCLDQFRANGYSEAEHPAPFLDVDRALDAMPEDGELEKASTEENKVPGSPPRA